MFCLRTYKNYGILPRLEEGNYEDYVKLLTGRLTWGILALHITIA